MTDTTPTDAMSPNGDAKQATDAEIPNPEYFEAGKLCARLIQYGFISESFHGAATRAIAVHVMDRLSAFETRVKELESDIADLEEQLSEADAAIQREGKHGYEAGNQDGYKEGFRDAEREYRRD